MSTEGEETKAATEEEEEKAEEEAHKEEESTATFEPVVQLEEVEVTSGEEEEEVLYTKRAKLFIYGESMLDAGTGIKNWKERGIGDVKILKHRERGTIRLLMRQEKTMKIIANHQLDPRIQISPHSGSDRSWVWSAFDFADGEKLVETVFCARFSDTEIANEFKGQFERALQAMKVLLKETAATDDAAADETAEALAELSTKDKEEEESKEES